MPPRRPKKSLYRVWKADLKRRRIKTKPLFTKNRKPRPSIPDMYPNIVGVHASHYRRKTEGSLFAIPAITRQSKRSGHGKGGGGGAQLLGKGARKSGSAASKRIGSARVGGTRGAKTKREKRKAKKNR